MGDQVREDAVPDVTPKTSREVPKEFDEDAIREAVAAERARCLAVARQMIARAERSCQGGGNLLGLTRDQWLAAAVVIEEIIEDIENPEAPNG